MFLHTAIAVIIVVVIVVVIFFGIHPRFKCLV